MKKILCILFLALELVSLNAFAMTRDFGFDRPGLDYRSYELSAPRLVLCEWRCDQEARCKAWTYVKPGFQGPNARCWLKYAVPRPVRSACCDSGTK